MSENSGSGWRPPIRVLTTQGLQVLAGLSEREASMVGRHWNAVRRYLDYGDESALAEFDDMLLGETEMPGQPGIPFGGYVLETDLDAIEWHAVRGDVRFESIYDEVQ